MNNSTYDDINRLINNGLANGNSTVNISNGLDPVIDNGRRRVIGNGSFNGNPGNNPTNSNNNSNNNGNNGGCLINNGNKLNGNGILINGNRRNGNGLNGNRRNGVNGNGLNGNGILNGNGNGLNRNGLLNGNGNGLNGNGNGLDEIINGIINGNGNGILNGNGNGILNGNGNGNGNGILNGNGNGILNGNGNGNGIVIDGNEEVTILPFPIENIGDNVVENNIEFSGAAKVIKQTLNKGDKLFTLSVPGNVSNLMISGLIHFKTRVKSSQSDVVTGKAQLYYAVKDSEGNILKTLKRSRDIVVVNGYSNNVIDIAEVLDTGDNDEAKTVEFGLLTVKNHKFGYELLQGRTGSYFIGNGYAYIE